MKVMTESEGGEWLARSKHFANASETQMIAQLKQAGIVNGTPDDAMSCFDLSRFLWTHLGRDEAYLLQIDHSIVTEDDELMLYQCYYKHATGFDCCGQSIRTLLQPDDRQHFVNLLSMNIMFKWDCLLANAEVGGIIHFSHDGVFSLLSADGEFLDALRQLGYVGT